MGTIDNIQELKLKQIFVFGTDMKGSHVGGHGRIAVDKFGAVVGNSEGMQGQSYAIPVVDGDKKISKYELYDYLERFYFCAKEHPCKEFILTDIMTWAGFDVNEMSYMTNLMHFPINVIMPKEFSRMKGYKCFDKDMKSDEGLVFEEGKDYEIEYLMEVEEMFSFEVHPLNLISYLEHSKTSRIYEVEGSGELFVDMTDDGTVYCNKLHIGKELNIRNVDDIIKRFSFYK